MGNIIDKALWGLNQAAFGDVRNIFKYNDFDFLMGKPIGLLANSYDYMANSLHRNIGNSIHHYDGYSTPIGEPANPFFNSFSRVPWFFLDGYKNSTANYLDYIRAVYGASLSVENINNNYDIRIVGEGSNVGVVQTLAIMNAINNSDIPANVSLINPNGVKTDTMLGIDSTYYVGKTLNNAISVNDERHRAGSIYGITNDLKNYFGLSTQAVLNNGILNISSHNQGESFLSDGYYDSKLVSPVYNSNYGIIDDIGIYGSYVDSLSEDSLFHFHYNAQLDVNSEKNSNGEIKYHADGRKIGAGADKKKYLPTKYENYLSSIDASYALELDKKRCKIEKDSLTIANASQGGVYVYAEKEGQTSAPYVNGSFNGGIKFGTYTSYSEGLAADDLLEKTNKSFRNGEYKTLIARFKTGKDETDLDSTTQTSISKKHGMSHGRNLLKLVPDSSQGYDNPYCRVWTYHHQYHRLADAIRPFQEKGNNGNVMITQDSLYKNYGFSEFSADHSEKGFENGRTRLGKHGVINQHNGLVNITPIDNKDANKKVNIKNCMFSIENLAWKDAWSTAESEKNTFQNGGLSSEQKGPFGGRIMWFPPYGLTFNETVSVDWNPNSFIGRGENVYTYKNTTRSGQLSFKLLIDHPSIINYWENRGKSVSNSVDDVDDPEQELLRFFAGCDFLSAKKATTKKVRVKSKNETRPSAKTEVYTFFVFYPNDYSGVDDNETDLAVDYLTNGIGTWKDKDGNDFYPSYSAFYVNGVPYGFGGYEMNPGYGISVVSSQEEKPNNFIASVKYGATTGETDIYAQIGPSGNHKWDRKWYYRVDKKWGNSDKLVKKENYIDKQSNGLNSKAGKSKIAEYFGISNTNNLFSFADMFVALTNSSKNSKEVLTGTYDENSVNKIISEIIGKKDKITEIVCTGQASIQGNSNPGQKNINRNNDLATNRAATIAKWLRRNLKGVNIHTAEPYTPEGDKIKDDVSGIVNKMHRNARIDIYVSKEESKVIQKSSLIEPHPLNYYDKNKEGKGYSGDTMERVNSGYRYNNMYQDYLDGSSNIFYDTSETKSRQTYMKLSTFGKSLDYLTFNMKNSINNNSVNINGVFNAIDNFRRINASVNDLSLNAPGSDIIDFSNNSRGGKSEEGNSSVTVKGLPDKISKNDGDIGTPYSEDLPDLGDYSSSDYSYGNQNIIKMKRYDDESKFFQMLELEEPFLHQKISDKIKYFDPAFHSVSPEGFNARLTFLQQCTRQGPTCGSSDVYTSNNTANNLSFGRPPVCILRIGDFYYTKIIIDSLTVDYDNNGVQWDLNAEGIGVMPMIANVNISFKFIGGSSLSGPISRLQNALSFNAYANTEVYDNRAELAEYDNNGNVTKFGPYNPSK